MAYWVAFDIMCLKQDPTKGLTNFKEEQDTTKVRIVVRDARLEPLSALMYAITLSNKPKDPNNPSFVFPYKHLKYFAPQIIQLLCELDAMHHQ